MENKHVPTMEEVRSFITAYGWHYRDTTSNNGVPVILSNYGVNPEKGILLSFHIEGEFMLTSTVGFLLQVPKSFSARLLEINDTLKLVKLYAVNSPDSETLNVEAGFELWNEAWNKDTFFAFIDMLCLGIETVLKKVADEQIPHTTNFITYQKQPVTNPMLSPTPTNPNDLQQTIKPSISDTSNPTVLVPTTLPPTNNNSN